MNVIDSRGHTRPSTAAHTLQRVIFPRPGEPHDVRTLYVDEPATNARRVHALSRTSMVIGAESEVSFHTYFNAFCASYWRRWSILEKVILQIEITGRGRVDLYRSKASGARVGLGGAVIDSTIGETDTVTLEIAADLGPFEDGGWLWFDLTADTEVTVHHASWCADVAAPSMRPDVAPDGQGGFTPTGNLVPNGNSVTIGIPTFNRPDDCVAALEALASDPAVDAVIDHVLVPDQGTKELKDHPDFQTVAAPFGERLRLFKQGNLGGSGGYSRILYEARQHTDSDYILFMDDDIAIEPDSILRALAFSRYARSPMLVGGQMLNLQERSHLHSMGERIDRSIFMWTSARYVDYDHDFALYPLSDLEKSANLHRRIDVDYNGWWMCMIPRVVADNIGQPLPLFIKWDDAEYGLRAAQAGYPTATIPGVAIWHMAWTDKDDAIDWQAYFHLRNRLIVAAIHHQGPVKPVVVSVIKAMLKHSLCLEYSTMAIQIKAVQDFLKGPEHLFEMLPTSLGEVAEMRKQYSDAVIIPSATELPKASGISESITDEPAATGVKVKRLLQGLAHSLGKENPVHHEVPQANFVPVDARWYSLSRVDGATVTTADGRGVVYRKRDRALAARLMKESLAVHKELHDNFASLQQRYRAASEELVSMQAWKEIFDAQ